MIILLISKKDQTKKKKKKNDWHPLLPNAVKSASNHCFFLKKNRYLVPHVGKVLFGKWKLCVVCCSYNVRWKEITKVVDRLLASYS